ncbi:MAG TPA: type VI secretion system tube protein Hcp, partial [Gemmataceae bacterium]|nr:type VI secretion system tube protein Hcp [Gemmataceae bacterium]
MPTDYLLVIEGIKGESGDRKHSGAIEVRSWSFEAHNSGSMAFGSGGGTGKAQFGSFAFPAWPSVASPPLLMASATGEHFKKATLYARKQGGQQETYLTITMTDVMVWHFSVGEDQKSARLIDRVDIDYAQIESEYRPQKADGTLGPAIKGGYNLKQNKKILPNRRPRSSGRWSRTASLRTWPSPSPLARTRRSAACPPGRLRSVR